MTYTNTMNEAVTDKQLINVERAFWTLTMVGNGSLDEATDVTPWVAWRIPGGSRWTRTVHFPPNSYGDTPYVEVTIHVDVDGTVDGVSGGW